MGSRSLSVHTVLASTAIGMLWTAYVCLNFIEHVRPRANNSLDRKFQSTMPIEVVISTYKEPVDDVAQLITNR